ncbi:RNA polymerase sigma factor (sigma-70 family) [Chitinophaga skermanii]|uniref:RNA polymerase sigma factor (Sigma-70 family) n=1 Tax=Chitinophaga skermanii TaxID=331697 RepID=A0A327Q1V0_9BACT|nr:RNA polymerase sigma factor [Chitinophaga skermanii]RAI98408.1 RNA polymerase sigma factor (sigma-70 family) [Chitinophaga skermanii]
MATEQDHRIQQTVQKERKRLLQFIRKRVDNVADAEDILQDVLFQFTQYLRVGTQVESITGWLFAVTRNKITDWFRKKKETNFSAGQMVNGEGEDTLYLSDILADVSAQADAPLFRKIISEAIMEAVDELPEEQRFVFLQHEVEGRSFKELSEATGVSVNTLLSRKRYAVLYLRERLFELYKELSSN